MGFNYKDSGVDIEAGDQLVEWLKKSENSRSSQKKNIVEGIGGFASLFRLNTQGMKSPCLISCTDGVGTKVKLASYFKKYDTVGQDLVAMCLNDLVCCGGKPLFFLDYYATPHLELESAQQFLTGVRNACEECDCVLIGGETAEMPGVYEPGDFDCAGFAVGIVDEAEALGARKVRPDDVVIGIASSGFHSNGYSLLRKAFAPDLDKWRDLLLRPTALYVRLVNELKKKTDLHAVAHITGGGIYNVPRVLPKGVDWQLQQWPWPAEFTEVLNRTGMAKEDLLSTLNCGIGLVVIASSQDENRVKETAQSCGFASYSIGHLIQSKHKDAEPGILL